MIVIDVDGRFGNEFVETPVLERNTLFGVMVPRVLN
jgi:hypothetical protein